MIRIISTRSLAVVIALFFIVAVSFRSDAQTIAAVDSVEAAKWREDLRFMAQEMPKRHKDLFHTMTREQFESAVKQLDERIPTLARHQIIVEMMRILAMVGDGHTSLNPLFNPKMEFRYYPITLYQYKDGLFIQSAGPKYADAIGARIVKIGDTSAEQAFKMVSEVSACDNEMTLKQRVPSLMTMPEVLQALGLIDDMEKAPFVIEENGKQTTIELAPAGKLPSMHDKDPRQGWLKANNGARSPVPLWQKAPQDNYWFEYLEDSRTIYLQYNQVANKPGESIADFAHRAFEFVNTHPVDRFILDVRLNQGGNGFLNMPLLLGLIKSEKINQRGHLFTIIGRGTFSAAQSLVNELERYTNTLFAGEPTGASVNGYGDHDMIPLPNSGLAVSVAPTWYQTMDPNDERPWIAPQIAAELTSEDYRTNNDPALNAIFNYRSIAELLTPALQANDIQLAIKQYHEFKADRKTSPINTENEINSLGYRLMGTNHLDQAIELFKLNVESYPNSSNAYDSLGEAYVKGGNKELAVKNYKRSIELNPKNVNSRQQLNKLEH
jgi:tetratricopeptide (TPR) repeat protein